jgi:CHAT domain-containing protein
VLSACYTGVPREHAASEFTSLPAAFLVAGARDVVAALWPAHDAAATLLMGAYYDALAANGVGASSDALAAARTRLKTMTRDEAIERLQGADAVPQRTIPFDAPHFADAFQHYGVD